jgi:thiol-disulfide isomerase/thioredoxin
MKNIFTLTVLACLLLQCGGNTKVMQSPGIYDFTLESIQGDKITLSKLKGKIVILDFWATWCPPCRVAIPNLIKLYDKYQSQDLIVLGIALDDKNAVIKLAQEIKINYPVLLDDKTTAKKYEIHSIPTLYLLDKKGKQVHKEIGFTEQGFKQIEEKVVELLNE